MKVKYRREVDILKVRLSDEPFDYAEESVGVISRMTSEGKPVLLEIQGARESILRSFTSMVKDEEVTLS